MEQLQIKRRINKQDCLLSLTEAELELAYRMKQREYLSQDFANALEEKAEEANCRFHFWNKFKCSYYCLRCKIVH
mgnify:CR=1 FL=1